MEAFGPLFFLIMIYFVISSVGKASRAAKQNAARRRPSPTQNPAPPAPEAGGDAPGPAETRTVTEPAAYAAPRPNIRDDSVYAGSMNAETGEGFDPCHDEQLAPLTEAEAEVPEPEPAAPSPILPRWTGGEIARGFVMAEILTKKENVRR